MCVEKPELFINTQYYSTHFRTWLAAGEIMPVYLGMLLSTNDNFSNSFEDQQEGLRALPRGSFLQLHPNSAHFCSTGLHFEYVFIIVIEKKKSILCFQFIYHTPYCEDDIESHYNLMKYAHIIAFCG